MSISSSTPHHNSRTTSEHGSRTSTRGNPTPETIQHRVMKSVSDYNRQLNQERKEDRRVCMDLQTYTIQYPVGLGRENRGLRQWSRKRRRISPIWRNGRRYPIALLPNQYQDWFLQYTTQELNYLPLNTVLHGPVAPDYDKLSSSFLQMTKNQNNENDTDSEFDGSDVLSDFDDDSTCSCGEVHCAPSPPVKSMDESMDNSQLSTSNNGPPIDSFDDKNFPQPSPANLQFQNGHNIDNSSEVSSSLNEAKICKVCKQQDTQGSNIEPLCCADCGVICHPACLDISGELLDAIRLYRWQCQDCKSCQKCGHPHDEERMMFCDKCDRGYHTYCVGLADIPQGHWVCSLCAICANCGTKNPGETSRQTSMQPLTISTASHQNKQWQHELIKIHSPDGQTLIRHSVFCETCYQLRKF